MKGPAMRSTCAVVIGLVWLTLYPCVLNAEDSAFTIGGTMEARPFVRFSAQSEGFFDTADYGSVTGISLDIDAKGPGARAYASLEASLSTGAAASEAWAAAALANMPGFEAGDLLMAPAYSEGETAPSRLVQARIRALYVKLDRDWVSLTAGRQIIKYQCAALWSPTDVYTDLDLSGISPLRRGLDALRLSFPLGATGELDLAWAGDANFAEGRCSARLSGLVWGIDAALIGYRDGRPGAAGGGSWNAGLALGADIGLAIDAEALVTLPDSGDSWLRAALGADYSIGRLVVAAEYYYNGGGPQADLATPGTHNAYLAVSLKAAELLSIGAAGIVGLSNDTWKTSCTATISAAQNADLGCFIMLSSSAGAWDTTILDSGISLTVKF